MRTSLLVLMVAGCAHAAGGDAPATLGGVVEHPAHVVPAMRICAMPTDGGAAVCVDKRAHEDRWQLSVPAGEYQVFAWSDRPGDGPGAYLQPVQCIRAPCPPMPATVRVRAGDVRDDIDVSGFEDARTDLPASPPAR